MKEKKKKREKCKSFSSSSAFTQVHSNSILSWKHPLCEKPCERNPHLPQPKPARLMDKSTSIPLSHSQSGLSFWGENPLCQPRAHGPAQSRERRRSAAEQTSPVLSLNQGPKSWPCCDKLHRGMPVLLKRGFLARLRIHRAQPKKTMGGSQGSPKPWHEIHNSSFGWAPWA